MVFQCCSSVCHQFRVKLLTSENTISDFPNVLLLLFRVHCYSVWIQNVRHILTKFLIHIQWTGEFFSCALLFRINWTSIHTCILKTAFIIKQIEQMNNEKSRTRTFSNLFSGRKVMVLYRISLLLFNQLFKTQKNYVSV